MSDMYADDAEEEEISAAKDKELYAGVREQFGEWVDYDFCEQGIVVS